VIVDRIDRFHDNGGPLDQRTPGQRDRDRILYAPEFRRLAGITQVVAPNEQPTLHNRLTHTLEVAQIGRRLAEYLVNDPANEELIQVAGGLDPDVVEAAALAHDLGHPPFGHVAEAELSHLAETKGLFDGFNGNAQSFRIVTKLSVRYEPVPGLNLTRATLNAILKYPWFRQTDDATQQRKWGAYHLERDEFTWARELSSPDVQQQSIEAALMDWADDIAYAIHDVEDFYRVGLIPLDRLVNDRDEVDRFLDAAFHRLTPIGGQPTLQERRLREIFEPLIDSFPLTEPYNGSHRHQAALKSFASGLIGAYVLATTIKTSQSGTDVVLDVDQRYIDEVAILKQLTWHYVIDRSLLATQQFGQQTVIRSLFNILAEDALGNTGARLFPQSFREQLEICSSNTQRIRIAIDYIASLTEQQAIELYRRVTGASFGSLLTQAGP
jgi:dGTPase